MKSLKSSALISNLRYKGISFEKGDTKLLENYNYYQIINAYKALFITGVKSLDDIKNDIANQLNLELYARIFAVQYTSMMQPITLYELIVRKIAKRYSESYKREQITILETTVREKKYLLHIYDIDVRVKDFIRMYQFEHGLRLILLKYVLRIEEELKNIFTQTLNDLECDSNYLLDINNFNVKDNDSISSLIKILKKNYNNHSNSINRKKEQSLIPPYWILINEMTMGELSYTIRCLSDTVKNSILDKVISKFTSLDTPSNPTRKSMLNLLSDISEFRNNLAHNNPIYQYNVKNSSLANFPRIAYLRPKISNYNNLSPENRAVARNNNVNQIKSDLVRFFGIDAYNQITTSAFNINLSYIIYVLNKITKKIDPSTNFAISLKQQFNTYGIINCVNTAYIDDFSTFSHALDNIQLTHKKLSNLLNLKYKHLTETRDLKSIISQIKSELTADYITLNQNMKKLKIQPNDPKYPSFSFVNEYSKYTGIDYNFLVNILQ